MAFVCLETELMRLKFIDIKYLLKMLNSLYSTNGRNKESMVDMLMILPKPSLYTSRQLQQMVLEEFDLKAMGSSGALIKKLQEVWNIETLVS